MPKALLFDLDGTLLDAFPGHFAAFRYMFSRFGIHYDEADFLRTYTPNWYAVFEAAGLPRQYWEQANAYWMEEAARHAPQPFPGVTETLQRLAVSCKLGVVTSGSRSRVMREIAAALPEIRFETVITGDDVTRRKPDPQGLELALQALGLPAADAVYVGDAQADLEMAAAAGMDFVGVRSRFQTLPLEIPRLIDSLVELPAALGLEPER